MQRSDERTVMFGHVTEGKEADTTIQQVAGATQMSASSIANAVPRFIQVEDFTTFTAEYALQDGNIVVHFFLPKDFNGPATDYWTIHFPKMLDATARSYFAANHPRLQAKYTEEVQSWWFRANGYEHIIDLKAFVMGFFETLDRALETRA